MRVLLFGFQRLKVSVCDFSHLEKLEQHVRFDVRFLGHRRRHGNALAGTLLFRQLHLNVIGHDRLNFAVIIGLKNEMKLLNSVPVANVLKSSVSKFQRSFFTHQKLLKQQRRVLAVDLLVRDGLDQLDSRLRLRHDRLQHFHRRQFVLRISL